MNETPLTPELPNRETGLARVREAAATLASKLHLIHKDENYKSVWFCAANHGVHYSGPKYENELRALDVALTRSRATPIGSGVKEEAANASTPTPMGLHNEETGAPKGEWLQDLITLYETPETVCAWLYAPHRLLDNMAPIVIVLGQKDGSKKVAAIVEQLTSGAYL